MIKFAYTILYVKDVLETITFYEKAFGLKRKFIAEDKEYGELTTGDTTLSFARIDFMNKSLTDGFIESTADQRPLGVEIAFSTENVTQLFDTAVNAGAIAVAKPEVKPWGQTVSYVRDMNGFLIEICTPLP